MTQSKTSLTPVSEETPWKDAVEEACIVNHLQIYPYDAKKTLANLINWEVLIALDPKVSKAAQDLFDAGAKSVVAAPQLENRSNKDYTIEHGEYLAKAATEFLKVSNERAKIGEESDSMEDLMNADEVLADHRSALESAVYEFRKRAKRALAGAAALPSAQKDEPLAYACPHECGCLWRDNKDETMSLFGPNSKSCAKCETMPLNALKPLWGVPPEFRAAANLLIDYCKAHDWGLMPEPFESINPLLKLLGRELPSPPVPSKEPK